jgi:hypothetical protein
MQYEDLLGKVRGLLRDAIEARYQGGMHAKKVQAQAYVDGYMRALTDAHQVPTEALLRLVTEERLRFIDQPGSSPGRD